jgi:hypothetical protein
MGRASTAHSDPPAPLAVPRALSDEERELLARLLDGGAPELAVLRRQASGAAVTGECACGCGTVRLSADCAVPPADLEGVVASGSVERRHGRTVEVRLHVAGGYVSTLEIAPTA